MGFIVIGGTAGIGKTTVAAELHRRLQCPWFEFGWIPEFRKLNPYTETTRRQEEQLSFENLVMVCQNYGKHGYENVIITDIDDARLLDIPDAFDGYSYMIATLYSEDDRIIRERILTRDNGNGFRDWETAVRINGMIKSRKLLPNEYRLRTDDKTVQQAVDEILKTVSLHQTVSGADLSRYSRDDYYSYITD